MMKCPYCGGEMLLKDAQYIYHCNRSKNWGMVWVCENFPKCDSYVGCHKGTQIPLGRPANARLRTLKKEAHRQFDPIWKSGLMTRKQAYHWLSSMLNIPFEDCHIGMMDIKDCQRTIHLCKSQDNRVINDFRAKHCGKTSKDIFTRGYNR